MATPAIQELTDRALAYIAIGYAVHLSGPAGTGKTTLALHIASKIGRRCTLLHGDDELRGSDLLGKDSGYRRQSIRDNYVSSILKTEETVSLMWSSNRLTTACEQGHTVIYDEFTRSPAAANNAFLSILEEGILTIPSSGQEKNYVHVHPDFRAIFTSNPEEYVGVHKSQDALIDRMITLEVSHQDRETELAIVQAKSHRSPEDAAKIVDVIRAMRDKLGSKNGPTIRAALAIAKILDHRGATVTCQDPVFMTTCQDVLYYNAARQAGKSFSRSDLESLLRTVVKTSVASLTGSAKGDALKVPATAPVTERAEGPRPIPTSTSTSTPSTAPSCAPTSATTNTPTSVSTPLVASVPVAPAASAEIARAAKDAVVRPVQEKPIDLVKATDELSGGDGQKEQTGRRLMRPPTFEVSTLPQGATV
ncbi:MAG: gas vesicle protein GvpN [Pirellulaceae bacterium]|nr:gas vesicle protein GvpN [Pirellulaceae bacterium]